MNATPADALAGHETVTTKGCAVTSTVVEADAVAPFASVTVKDSVAVPLTCSVRLTNPVPEYGLVPPVADTVQLNGFPAVMPLTGQVTVTTSGWPPTVTVALPLAVTPFASVTLNDSVLTPFVGSVTLNVPVPL